MIGSAGGTMVGGVLADRSGRHQRIIIGGLALAAVLLVLIGRVELPTPVLLAAVALAGALAGMTTPSRDMLVRAAAPPGASGKVFGFVYSGLDLGSTLTPTLVGSLLDARPCRSGVHAGPAGHGRQHPDRDLDPHPPAGPCRHGIIAPPRCGRDGLGCRTAASGRRSASMTALQAILLLAAGFAGGTVNAIAGGATFFTFPAMLAVGIPPVAANASNTVALFPASLAATIALRRELATTRQHLLRLVLIGIVGGTAGAFLLLATPDRAFLALVPWLLLLATSVFTFSPRLLAWLRSRSATPTSASGLAPRRCC